MRVAFQQRRGCGSQDHRNSILHFLLLRPTTFPLLMSLLGASPIHEAKWSSFSKRLMSVPTSEITVNAVITLTPSMEVRSHSANPFQFRLQVHLWFVIPRLSRLFSFLQHAFRCGLQRRGILQSLGRQAGQVNRQSVVTLLHLPVREMIAVDSLLQLEQQVGPPVSFETPCHFFPGCLHPVINQARQRVGVSLALKDGTDDRLPAESTDIADYVGQLHVHLCQ